MDVNKPEETGAEPMINKSAKELAKIAAKQAKQAKLASKEAAKEIIKEAKPVVEKVKKALVVPTQVKKEEEKELDLETAMKIKRDLSQMAEKYEPHNVEKYWYQWWKDNKFWHANAEKAAVDPWDKKFTIVLPPPNVTGSLHIGHALMLTIEDTIVRW